MLDGLLLSAASVQEISMRRRDLQRPYISEAYCILASPAVPITTNLYGDNISETISSITESNKLVRRISFPPAFDNRPQQYFHNRSQPPRESLSTTEGEPLNHRDRVFITTFILSFVNITNVTKDTCQGFPTKRRL